MNPYEDLGNYTQEVMRAHASGSAREPHVFAIAERIWKGFGESDRPHAVVVSGESGAGKTETNKHMIAYLRWRAADVASSGGAYAATAEPAVAKHLSSGGGEGGGTSKGLRGLVDRGSSPPGKRNSVATRISNTISIADTILEAVGNAKTLHNNNSSRFGKYLILTFDTSLNMCEAQFRTYLLEKSRVVRQAPFERNFHVFYQLCEGAPPEIRSALQLRRAEDHAYTKQHTEVAGVQDAEKFTRLRQALQAVDVGENDVWSLLAAALHLGDMQFDGDDGSSSVADGTRSSLAAASAQLGIKPDELESRITTRFISVGGKAEDLEIPVPPEGAGQARASSDDDNDDDDDDGD
eukprot:4219000-Pleurochrysis_carterae.AAC.1